MSFRHFSKARPHVMRIDDRLSLSFDELRVQSEMRLDAPDELVLGYTRTMMGFLLFCPQPARIAMIGLGGGSIPKYCYATLPESDITVVEIDPDVIALRERFFIPADDARFRILCEDGAAFVGRTQGRYDVLVVDGFNAQGQPAMLSTQRFYNDCRAMLTEGGIMVVNLPDLLETYEPLWARINHSFGHHTILLTAEDSSNRIAFAGKCCDLDASSEQLLDRLSMLGVHRPLNLYQTVQAIGAWREHNPVPL
jgi:spermidine synthase